MPFSCHLGDKVIHASSYSLISWEDLKIEVASGTCTLRLPCCGRPAVLRSGSRCRQHFAHRPGMNCQSDSWSDYCGRKHRRHRSAESVDHARVKEIIREVAERAGWHTTIEQEGFSAAGKRWVADVYAVKDDLKVVFEVQVSSQLFREYRIRQERYRDSATKCVWLSCVVPEASSVDVPIFELSKVQGTFVIDFPPFFTPDLLRLPSDVSGLSLGEFTQLLLEYRIPWTEQWAQVHDQLAADATQIVFSRPVGVLQEQEADDDDVFPLTRVKEKAGWTGRREVPGADMPLLRSGLVRREQGARVEEKLPAGAPAWWEEIPPKELLNRLKPPPYYDPGRAHRCIGFHFTKGGQLVGYWYRRDQFSARDVAKMEAENKGGRWIVYDCRLREIVYNEEA